MLPYAKTRLFVTTAVCLLTTSFSSAAENKGPTFVSFQVPGAVRTLPLSINDFMSVTGYWIDTARSSHGFVRDGLGNITSFDPAGSIFTEPLSINVLGAVAGNFETAPGYSQGFVRTRDGAITTFNPGGSGGSTFVSAINNQGQILGVYATMVNSPTLTAFIRQPNGTIQVLNLPQTLNATPSALNDLDEITGGYSLNGGTQTGGFVRSPGGMITTFTEEQGTAPLAINDAGLVAGVVRTGTSQGEDGFVRSPDGTITQFALPGSVQNGYIGLNQEGEIAGSFLIVQTKAPTYLTESFVRSPKGSIVTFIVPGAVSQTSATSINDLGVVTGSSDSATYPGGFLRIPNGSL